MNYEVQVLKMGQCKVPGPEIYWMSHWDTWETLFFWMVVVQGEGFTALINTGPPRDLAELNRFWYHFAGERCEMRRQETERPENALESIGVDPLKVDHTAAVLRQREHTPVQECNRVHLAPRLD